ncbi:hypothetical protein GCM10027026_07040 [Myroides odoratimimus subsp. xuanwuensis]
MSTYPRRYCSVCDHVVRREFKPGPGGRPDASCPRCRSLERHRFLAILLSSLRPTLGSIGTLLDVAPSTAVTPLLERLEPRRHLRLDLGADNRLVDVLGSLTDLPCADDSVDLLVCYHVLEHVPDDRRAMAEIARVLSPGGLGILQVPWRPGTTTDEDPSAPEEERIARFGQADHVRYYGDDFEDRLIESGLSLQRITPRALVGEAMSEWLKVNPGESVWLVRSDPDAQVPAPGEVRPTALTLLNDVVLERLEEHHEQLGQARQRVQRVEARRDQLRDEVRRLRLANQTLREERARRERRSPRRVARAVRRRVLDRLPGRGDASR